VVGREREAGATPHQCLHPVASVGELNSVGRTGDSSHTHTDTHTHTHLPRAHGQLAAVDRQVQTHADQRRQRRSLTVGAMGDRGGNALKGALHVAAHRGVRVLVDGQRSVGRLHVGA